MDASLLGRLSRGTERVGSEQVSECRFRKSLEEPRALLALAAHNYGYRDQAKTLIANLENGVKIDTQPDTSIVQRGAQSSDPSVIGTAHWGEDGVYWRWSDGGVEATS